MGLLNDIFDASFVGQRLNNVRNSRNARQKQSEEYAMKNKPLSELVPDPSVDPELINKVFGETGEMTPEMVSKLAQENPIPKSYRGLTQDQFKDISGGVENLARAKAYGTKQDEILSPSEAEQLNVPYGTSKKGAIGKIPKNPRLEGLQAERERRNEERKTDRSNNILKLFNSDPSVKKSQQSLDAANMIEELATSGNPIAASAIPTYSARMSGEVGNLSEADKRPFGGSQAVIKRLDAIWEQAKSGQLTEDNKKYILDLTSIVNKRANENIIDLAKKRSKQYSKVKGNPSESELLSTFSPDYVPGGNSKLTPEEQAELDKLEKEVGGK